MVIPGRVDVTSRVRVQGREHIPACQTTGFVAVVQTYVHPSLSTIPSSSTTPGILSPDNAFRRTTSL